MEQTKELNYYYYYYNRRYHHRSNRHHHHKHHHHHHHQSQQTTATILLQNVTEIFGTYMSNSNNLYGCSYKERAWHQSTKYNATS
jgi:hypothetical protein